MPLPTHKITICGIPELSQHCSIGVSHVLSIIDTHEPRPPVLDDFRGVDHELVRFDDIVAEYPGFEACTPAHIAKVLEFGDRVHAAPGREEAAFLRLLELRKHGWPNTRMVEFADQLLKRDGAMLRGLLAYRRALLDEKPHLSEIIRNIGRGHELPV